MNKRPEIEKRCEECFREFVTRGGPQCILCPSCYAKKRRRDAVEYAKRRRERERVIEVGFLKKYDKLYVRSVTTNQLQQLQPPKFATMINRILKHEVGYVGV